MADVMKKGDIVLYMFDTGATTGPSYGVVIQAGPKTFDVVWGSCGHYGRIAGAGNRNRFGQDARGIRKLAKSEIDDDILRKVRSERTEDVLGGR